MRTILILVAVFALTAPAAEAGWHTKLERSEQAAAAHFGTRPACAEITTVRRDLPFGDDGEAWSPCTVALDNAWLRELKQAPMHRAMRFRYVCRLWVHEYGHLLGMEHSPDPADVMAEIITVTPHACYEV